jgi:hypothetical protein
MKLSELIERLFGLEKRVDQLETKQSNLNAGLLEAMLREQMRKKQSNPLDPPSWFEPRLR